MSERNVKKGSALYSIFSHLLFSLVKTFCLGSFAFACLILFVAAVVYLTEKSMTPLLFLVLIYLYPRIVIFFWRRARFLGPGTTMPERNFSREFSWDI
jgi:hypothetical protein